MAIEKACRECGQTKPIAEFYRHPQMGDGYLNHCKDCKRGYARRRHYENGDDPDWVEKQRARGRDKYRRLYATGTTRVSPPGTADQKKKAAQAVGNAVRDGRMSKPDRCEECGEKHHRIHGHHSDYNKPLDVEWLCPPCHITRHVVSIEVAA